MASRGDDKPIRPLSRAPGNGTAPAGREGCRILLIDADLGLLAALAVTLGPAVDLDQAVTMADALACMIGAPPHLVILNPALPELDGPSLLRAVRAQAPDCAVLAVADHLQARRAVELAAMPLEGLLWKPVPLPKLLGHVTGLLGRRAPHPAPLAALRVSAPVVRCLDYVSHHYGDALTLRSIGHAVGVSVSHLAHRFRAETGMTVKAYLTGIRVAATGHLLAKTELKLESIAEIVGFCDASHLSRVFRALSGHRPGEYRRWASTRPARLVRVPQVLRAPLENPGAV